MDKKRCIEILIEHYGGNQSAVAREFGFSSRATVYNWRVSGLIPTEHALKVSRLCPAISVEDIHREHEEAKAGKAA